jgi:hypothetical protein
MSWLEEELGVEVVERGTGNADAAVDYERFMEAIREGGIRHTGHREFRRHVMNAIARNLGGDKKRFDRPVSSRSNAKEQDRRVIDARTAAGFMTRWRRPFSPPSRRPSRRSRSSARSRWYDRHTGRIKGSVEVRSLVERRDLRRHLDAHAEKDKQPYRRAAGRGWLRRPEVRRTMAAATRPLERALERAAQHYPAPARLQQPPRCSPPGAHYSACGYRPDGSTRWSARLHVPSPPPPDPAPVASPGTTLPPSAGSPRAMAPTSGPTRVSYVSPPPHPRPTSKPTSSNIR